MPVIVGPKGNLNSVKPFSHLIVIPKSLTLRDEGENKTNSRKERRTAWQRGRLRGNNTSRFVAWPGRVAPNATAMASPNSHSSSAATPDGLFEEATENTGCTHISALLAGSTESDPLLKRFRRVVSWKAQRTHDALHSAKRRKVRFIFLPRYLSHAHICD